MKYASLLIFFLVPGISVRAQQPLRLSLKQAIALATSPRASAAVQVADAEASAASARLALARSYRYPMISGTGSVSNLTRNLGAEGFNFPTGVPGFEIPDEVGPFNVYDARIEMSQTVFDLAAIRRSRAVQAALQVARSNASVTRQASAAQVARDYLQAVAAEAKAQCALDAVADSRAAVEGAQREIDAGKASDAALTHAQLDLSANRRKLIAAQNAVADAHLQLSADLGLDFDLQLQLTDKLGLDSPQPANLSQEIQTALHTRGELQVAAERLEQAQDQSAAVHAGSLPSVAAYGDVGPQNLVITHTVGVSARITLFDGGRRSAQQAEANAAVRQYSIQQKDAARQIELEVRRAFSSLQAAADRARESDASLALSREETARAQRRFAQGVGNNAELVIAQLAEIAAREEQVEAYLARDEARLQLAQATGTVATF